MPTCEFVICVRAKLVLPVTTLFRIFFLRVSFFGGGGEKTSGASGIFSSLSRFSHVGLWGSNNWNFVERSTGSCLIHLHLLDYDNENLDDEWAVKTCGFFFPLPIDLLFDWLSPTTTTSLCVHGLKGGYNISPFVYSTTRSRTFHVRNRRKTCIRD